MIQFQTHSHQVNPPARQDPVPVVFVVDHDASVREEIELLIQSAGWRTVAFECARKFLACHRPPAPSCVVLDVSLPDIDGLELQQRIAADGDGLPVVFLTAHEDVTTTVRAMKAGAVDFLTKPLRADELLPAIASAIERCRTGQLERAERRELQERYSTLTRREREVMALVAAGMLNKVAGAQLGISEITVKAHRGRTMQKMKAPSLAGLVRMAELLRISRPIGGVARDLCMGHACVSD